MSARATIKDLIPQKVKKAVDFLFQSPAICSTELRQAVEAHTAHQSGGMRQQQVLPADLVDYLNKITHRASEITDQDIQNLIHAGYSEDEIFEITVCASTGAGLARMEIGLALISGE